jgi:NADH-quinone oxidoreductase subunit C
MHKIEEFQNKMKDKIGSIIEKKDRLYFEVPDKNILEVAAYLSKDMGCRLSTATCMEVYRGIEVLYHFSDDSTGTYFCPRVVMTDKNNPVMHSISPVVKGAEWIEREMAEYWGVTFEGHPRPEPLLTKDHPKGEGLGQPFRIRRQA